MRRSPDERLCGRSPDRLRRRARRAAPAVQRRDREIAV